jgi:hypothetical protein
MEIFKIKDYNSKSVYENEKSTKEFVSIQIEWLNAKKNINVIVPCSMFFLENDKPLRNEKTFAGPSECGPHTILVVHQMATRKRISSSYRSRPR